MFTARRVVKNTTVLFLARMLSIGLGIIYIAALARYIHPTGMGKIAIALSLVSVVTLLANWGLSQVLIRDVASDRSRATTYVANVLSLRVALSLICCLVLGILTQLTPYSDDTILIIYIYGIAYVLDVLTDVAFSIFNAFEQMEYQAAIQIGRDIVNIGVSLAAIYVGASLIVIVFVSVVANVLKLAVSFAIMRWRFVKPTWTIDLRLCRQLLFVATPFAAIVFIELIDRAMDPFLLSLFHPEEQVGWFSAAGTLISYLMLLPTQFLQAIFPVFARFHNMSGDALQQSYRLSFKYLVLLGLPLWAGTIATADDVIALVYGPGFENGALALRVLAFNLFWMFGFANGGLLIATGRQTLLAGIEGAGIIVNAICAWFLIPSYGFLGASIAAISSGVVFAFPIVVICHRQLRLRVPIGLIFKSLIASIVMGVAVAATLRVGMNLFAAIFAVAPLVLVMALALLRVIDRDEVMMLARLVSRQRERAQVSEMPAGNG